MGVTLLRGIGKGYHSSIQGIQKGYLSSQKWYIKGYGVELPGGASPYKTFLSIPRGVSIETRKTLFGILVSSKNVSPEACRSLGFNDA